ncbi:hypothetical protein I4U23_027129 [Adineta vaga]|nr:hypothetical protein I4U23_027129 [Adineta vaga]
MYSWFASSFRKVDPTPFLSSNQVCFIHEKTRVTCAKKLFLCFQKSAVRRCPTKTCAIITYVDNGKFYSSDCYEEEKYFNRIVQWQHIKLPKGKTGYVLAEHCKDNNFTFEQLNKLNITSDDILHWSLSIDLAEQYQYYLDQTIISNLSNKRFFNCTNSWFGSHCQYSLLEFNENENSSEIILTHGTCYILLECNRGGLSICLDWREICNGRIDCLNNGIDEIECYHLELNECNENEYRCSNGMCIPNLFLQIQSFESCCLDRSDLLDDYNCLEFYFHGNLFECEEYQCSPNQGKFSCNNGKCVEDFHQCDNNRHMDLIHSITIQGNLSLKCWIGMICLTKILNQIKNISCHEIILKEYLIDCQNLLQFPIIPVLFGHVRFLYDLNETLTLKPTYICYDSQLCDYLIPTFNYSYLNLTCQHRNNMGLEENIELDDWKSMIDIIKPYFNGCITQFYSSMNKNHSSLYHCKNSSKFISKYRIIDSITDCYLNDDEQAYELSCLLNETSRFQCPNEKQCRSPLFSQKICSSSFEININKLLFYQICNQIVDLPFILINGRNHSDETDCEYWICNNIYTRCDNIHHCINGEDEQNCTKIISSQDFLSSISLETALIYPLLNITNEIDLNENEIIEDFIENISLRLNICHRGLYVYYRYGLNNFNGICFCPSNYYGNRCQYQNQRVSLTILFSSIDHDIIYSLIIILFEDDNNEERIHSYHQLTYISKMHCGKSMNIYLLYLNRSKNLFQNYSIRIHAFDKSLKMKYLLTWYFQISFLFLPVNRLTIVLTLPINQMSLNNLCNIQCFNGICIKYYNVEKYFCRCYSGWSGAQCQIPIDCYMCASNSICIGSIENRSICVCPDGKFGTYCRLKLKCPEKFCENNGHCVVIDHRRINDSYVCFCSEEFFGSKCGNIKNRIDILFKNIPIPSYIFANIYQTIDFEQLIPTLVILKKVLMFENSIRIYSQLNFRMILIKFQSDFYLSVFEKFEISNITTSVSPYQRCISINNLFNNEILSLPRIHRLKYYQLPCQHNLNLQCFFDEFYMCLCTREHHSNCFLFDHQMNFICKDNVYCENGGTCLQDQSMCLLSILCVCIDCFFGNRCQFYAKGIGLTLDDLLRYEIRPNIIFNNQSLLIKLSTFFIFTIFFIGLINSFFGYIILHHRKSRRIGSGIYLLFSSIISTFVVSLLLIKYWFIIYIYINPSIDRLILRIGCLLMEPLLRLVLYMSNWLNSCVSIERTMSVYYGIQFNRRRSRSIARWISLILPFLILISMIFELINRDLFDDYDENRVWCVLHYSKFIQTSTTIIQLFHFIIPFLVNLFSAIFITYNITRRQVSLRNRNRSQKRLINQINKHKQLLISPIILILLLFPHLLISLLSGCIKTSRNSSLFLIGYFISFIPSSFVFIIFVLPSTFYRRQFRELISQWYQTCRRIIH